MAIRKSLKTKIPLALAAAALLSFALWAAPSIESHWAPGSPTADHHQIRLGLLDYLQISLDRPQAAGTWIRSADVRPGNLLWTALLTALVAGFGYWGSRDWLRQADPHGG
jgi:hypothetical protein